MLPKVSSALAQLIKPIAPRAVQSQKQEGKRQARQDSAERQDSAPSFERFKKEPEPAPEDPLENKVIPFPLKTAASAPASPAASEKRPTGLTDALLQLKAVIAEQSSQVTQWVAGKKYKAESQAKKKAVTGKKGAIVDHKAE